MTCTSIDGSLPLMMQNRKLNVFLCHSKDDKPKVRELCRRLLDDGFEVWLDEEKLLPGQDWDLEIRKAVRAADVVLVCLSNGSVTKAGYVQKEIRLALDVADEQPEGATFIIPARLEECTAPSRLSQWQWVDLFTDSGYERLKKALAHQAEKTGKVVRSASLQNGSTDVIEPLMVRIPAGKFLMGSTKEQTVQAIRGGVDKNWVRAETPQHTVELSEYFIGKYPVTNLEYQAFVHDTKCASPRGWTDDRFPAGSGEHPVVNVSWSDASAYCKWLSERTGKAYCLPTEAEWEKAARGEDGRLFPWGDQFDGSRANTLEATLETFSEVGQFSPQGDSPYGCADMAGNVWEWCNDWFDENQYKRNRVGTVVKDPLGIQVGESRVLRGGSYYFNLWHARCATRSWNYPNHVLRFMVGFRVCISPARQMVAY
ncbi:MAG TPA: SUMF1/EgtB/PvdO family nonheme iron enzyme [Anaerolineales bacterium]|nr:SUMF1/EgtB/PvdO family nonheme iron enzyme [Anaerolineales bacterium]